MFISFALRIRGDHYPHILEELAFAMDTAFCPRLTEKMESLEEAEPYRIIYSVLSQNVLF